MNRTNQRKKILVTAILLAIVIAGTEVMWSALFGSPSVKYVPEGYTVKNEHLDLFALQDFTDFCIYRYPSADVMENNSDYQQMTAEDAENLRGYFEDFGTWLDSKNLLKQCAAAEECISAGDFCRIDTREGDPIGDGVYGKYDDYSVWFFDAETATLYYVHNNV